MKQNQILALALAIGITLTTAILYGRWTHSWNTAAAEPAATVFQNLPHEIGPWKLEESLEIKPSALEILQCNHYSQGWYRNGDTGERAMLTLLLGPPGPMSVHTPEICYSAVDFIPVAERQRVKVRPGVEDDTAWMVQFNSAHDLQAGITRVYYAWSDGTHWTAAEEPRVTFGGQPFLFKVQILTQLPTNAVSAVEDSARSIFRDFLPEFAKCAAAIDSTTTN
jgi:hypothetical protein